MYDPKRPPHRIKKPMRRLSSKVIAVSIFSAVSIWIASGLLLPSNSQNLAERTFEKTIPSVRVKQSSSEQIEREIILYGSTESIRKVTLKAETNGKVVSIMAEEGYPINKGDPILLLDIKDRKARLSEANALVKQRQLEYNVAKTLAKSGHQSDTKLAAAYTALNSSKAALLKVEIEIEDTHIRSPFNGILEKLYLEKGDLVSKAGTDIATIVDQNTFLAVGQVPEQMVKSITVGSTGYITTVTGIETTGIVKYISKIADPLTRTFRVELEAKNDSYNLQEGVTTEIRIPIELIKAHVIPSSVFALDEDGSIGLKLLTANNRVKFYPVTIIKETTEGVWISGIPDEATIITYGQAFLRDGDTAKVEEG